MSPQLIWSWNFESGTQWSNSGPLSSIACGNNPGTVVSTLAHSGKYSGYYAVSDPSAPDPCASFPSYDTVNQNTNPWTSKITTDDYSTTVWVYVPSQPLSGWTSYVTIEMGNGTNWNYAEGIAIDATANRQLYIYNNGLFVNSQGSKNWGYYTWETTMYYPLNQWFSITVEIHQRPSTQNSWMVLYQNGVEVQRLIDHEANPTPWLPWTFHWGMYVGSGQQTSFQMYNDDISIYNLAGTASSVSPTSTAPSRASTLSVTPLFATPLAVMSLASLGIQLRRRGRGRAGREAPEPAPPA